ncbi:hypothetical protein EDC14_101083 [Hydrogenispora ethanolica]|jgi:hypothetical protein|uniref:Uncharacterized protein n=1 Tax=Hydrogenispora ethanolica TaxID=1082276 RepID=A0A4R1RUN9_HYDET|nr:hypothetical protein [Hydrogenispora ethanolica]TCL70094.1 hypothetical protein EDC14_101083 [Hydrogenispora ethanolica]
MLGMTVGLAADGVKLLFNYLAFQLGFTKVLFWQIVAARFLDPEELFQPLAYLVGGVADLTIAALLGTVFVYLLDGIRREYRWVKGAGFGLVVWVILLGTLLNQTAPKGLPISGATMVVTFLAHLLFGLALAGFDRAWVRNRAG